MSRIGRLPIDIPAKVKVEVLGRKVFVEGPKGKLDFNLPRRTSAAVEGAKINVTVEENTKLTIEGPSKELVGQVAAEIRSFYPPEPYKGKGVRYVGEHVQRKEGKTVQ